MRKQTFYLNGEDIFAKIEKLERENKKLTEITNEAKIEYENLLINRNDFADRATKLEQENEKLKEKINELNTILKMIG